MGNKHWRWEVSVKDELEVVVMGQQRRNQKNHRNSKTWIHLLELKQESHRTVQRQIQIFARALGGQVAQLLPGGPDERVLRQASALLMGTRFPPFTHCSFFHGSFSHWMKICIQVIRWWDLSSFCPVKQWRTIPFPLLFEVFPGFKSSLFQN